MQKKLCLFVSFLFFFFKFTSMTLADQNFDVAYDITYRFKEDKTAQVTQTTTLTNKITNLYATEYEGSIFGMVSGEVSGFDASGPIEVSTSKKDDKETIIKAILKEKTVGTGNKTTFSINYNLSGLITQNGRVSEIAIPRPAKDSTITEYKVTVIIPKSYGPIGFVKPQTSYTQSESSYVLTFDTKGSLQGILIGIGDVAHYSFNIQYHLNNDSLIKREVEIALPPDSLYQQVLFTDLVPKPENVTIDKDGNWIASYILSPREESVVNLVGNVLIWTTPRENFNESPPLENHTASNKFWETESDEVSKTAESFKSAADIYSYLVNTLSYNYARVGAAENKRMGASEILKNPQLAICMEFTDAFVALSRKIGIPSREVNGYAYTTDEFLKPLSLVADVLHSWPEYWDSQKKQWIPVDPTWENTTGGVDYFNNMDFNHFVFARHGVSSIFPPAAGAYKKSGDEKDVIIKPEVDLPQIPNSEVLAEIDLPKTLFAGENHKVTITLENTGGIARYNLPISITGNDLNVELPREKIDLPPYGKRIVEGNIRPNEKVWGEVKVLGIAADKREEIDITVSPKQAIQLPLILGMFVIIIGILIILMRRKYAKKK